MSRNSTHTHAHILYISYIYLHRCINTGIEQTQYQKVMLIVDELDLCS